MLIDDVQGNDAAASVAPEAPESPIVPAAPI